MQEELSIEELQRRADGHKALLSAIDKVMKADNDLKLDPRSDNFKKAYRNAFNKLKTIANNEYQHTQLKQNSLF